MKVGDRVRLLRDRRAWSQTDLAARVGPDFPRSYIGKIEIGLNQLSSYDLRTTIAKAFGLRLEEFDAYLDGRLSVDDAAKRGEETDDDPLALMGLDPEIPLRPVPEKPPTPTVWEQALWDAARGDGFGPQDYESVLRALPPQFDPNALGFEPKEVARGLLSAAVALRRRATPVTQRSLLAFLAVQPRQGV